LSDQDNPPTGFGSNGPRGSTVGQPPPGAYPYRPELEGSSCTLDGRPGVLTRSAQNSNWLVCRPIEQQQSFVGSANGDDGPDPELAQSDRRSVADVQRAHAKKMSRLYAQRDAELSQQWRSK
jgi:hypothetical protein